MLHDTPVGSDASVLLGAHEGTSVVARPGDRFHHVFEERCDELRATGRPGHLAVDTGHVRLTYGDLDERANRVAGLLADRGVRPGDRVGLLFDGAVDSYAAILAVSKLHAAYVPLDTGFPEDRLAYIVADAGVTLVVTLSHLATRLEPIGTPTVCLDSEADAIAAQSASRPEPDAGAGSADTELCYIIYTSGSTGRPKGVAVEHASICNFVRVAAEAYGLQPGDRVYQGMTIAFDFSVEEIWVPLAAGATVVPRPQGPSLVGRDLWRYLVEHRVTALCCVPTLLATIDEDLPGLRFLLVSGEACPHDLVMRWYREGRTFLNVYGPTEASVTATWTHVHPGDSVTIGVPLPSYAVVVLHEADAAAVPRGAVGEIGISGVCLARGYVNRDDLTSRAFVEDFLGLPDNPSGRIYRTGDLGRIDERGEIEYLGRIDTQVKIRGYRIELTEIESVMLGVPGVQQAVVATHERAPGVTELVGYYTTREGVDGVDHGELAREIRSQLPPYMVPAFFEELAVLPTLACDKVDRKRLPPPRLGRYVTDRAQVGPANEVEQELASSLADLLGLEDVSVEAHFFDDLGANSLVLAQLCTRARERAGIDVSMKDMYQHPTVRSVAAHLRTTVPRPETEVSRRAAAPPAPTLHYVLCGVLQLLFFSAYTLLGAVVFVEAYDWISEGSGLLTLYLRSVVLGVVTFVVLSAIPVALKWCLVGRWKPGAIPIWGPAYLRFWVIRQSLRLSPMLLLAGSPLYNVYLRALGARIGRNAVILTTSFPVCTDLISVGDDTVIRKQASLLGYRARAGWIETGPVAVGSRAFVGEASVLDIGTTIEDGGRLAHASALHEGQDVPAGSSYHGSPAEESADEFPTVAPKPCGRARRVRYSVAQLAGRFAVEGPLLVAGVAGLAVFDVSRVGGSLLVFAGGLALGLVAVMTIPRALQRLIEPGRVYPLYGLHYSVAQTIARVGSSRFFNNLFGDSSYVVAYLRGVGVDLTSVQQTGSNFGLFQMFEAPLLCHVGPGTMVSDGLSMMNADLSSSSFTLSHTSIGAGSFLGNEIHYPPQGRTGDNCLLATKVMVPTSGPVREGVGLLGSPPFEIPRSVQRDKQFDHLRTGPALRERLARKNRVNLVTIALYLLSRWLYFYACTLIAVGILEIHEGGEVLHVTAAAGALLLFTMAYFVLVERLSLGFKRLRPQYCSIYDPYYWGHERYWKLNDAAYLALLNGTPFKGLAWRLLGARVGRRLFDDGCAMPEKTLVEIGDDCTLGDRTTLQCHSLEDGTFKSDRIVIGSGCTLGTNSFVHYGVVIGDGVVIAPDSFLMKGETPSAGSAWGGNPARLTQG